MGVGRAFGRLAALGAAIGGVVFFWRKRHPKDAGPATTPTASDTP
jgi:hypothetical protein